MNLYVIHDDPQERMDPEDRTLLAVWANTEAVTIYLHDHLDAGPWDDDADHADLPLSVWETDSSIPPLHDRPHVEERGEVPRLFGWYRPGERPCERCDLYPCGSAAGKLCPECYVCRTCGCACEEEPCNQES